MKMIRRNVLMAGRNCLILLALLIVGCGGGGSGSGSSNAEQPASDNSSNETIDNELPETEFQDGDSQGQESQDPEAQNPDVQDPAMQEPEMQEPQSQGGDAAESVLRGGAVAQLAVISGIPAVGVDGGTVLGINDLTINGGGGLAFHSRVETPLIDASRAQSHVFAGSLTSQRLVIGPDSPVRDLTAGFNFEASMELSVASDGAIATVARVRDEGLPNDFFDGSTSTAVIRADASGAVSLVTAGDMVTALSGEVPLSTIDQVSISRSGVAFLGRVRVQGSSFALFVQEEDGFKSVAEGLNSSGEVAPTIDGCRILLSRNSTQQFQMLDSGVLVFNATIDGGRVSSPCQRSQSAVLRHVNDVLSVIIREGDPVPGSSTFEFGSISLLNVLSDGSVLFRSTIEDRTRGFAQRDIISRQSAWLVTSEDELRLVYMEGETLERGDGSVVLELGNFAPGFNPPMDIEIAVHRSGTVGLRVEEQPASRSNRRLSLHVGTLPTVQPHSNLEVPGSSGLTFSDEAYNNAQFPGTSILALVGSPDVASGFVETDRLFPIGSVTIDSQGNLYFHARVLDTLTLTEKGDYIFRRDASGQLSVVVSPLDRVMVNGREELILSSVIRSDFGSLVQGTPVRLVVMEDDSLLVQDVGRGSAVLLRFP